MQRLFLSMHGLIILIVILLQAYGPSWADEKRPLQLWLQEHPALGYRSSLPRDLIERSKAIIGDKTRARKFVHKLLQGQHVKLAVLGSSLATCRGASHMDSGWPALVHKWLELAFTLCGLQLPGFHFFSSSPQYWFQHQRHLCNDSTVQYIDMAVYASTPLFSEMCMVPKVPSDVDLVIIEYGVNDMAYPGEFSGKFTDLASMGNKMMLTTERLALERMVRKLLMLPGKPAVIMFEVYSWHVADGRFGMLPQDMHSVMAQYYGNVQVLSARSVMHPLLHARNGTWASTISAEEVRASGLYQQDLVHPSDAGHRLYADILISFLQGEALEELVIGGSLHQHLDAYASVQPPLGGHPAMAGAQGLAMPMGSVLAAMMQLPPPLAQGNWETGARQCFLNHDAKDLVTSQNGFEFKDEGETLSNGYVKHKFGFVAMQPGSTLTIRIDSSLQGTALDKKQVYVLLSHLRSYEGMGSAEVSCVGGCLCMPTTINAHMTINASLTSFASLTVSPHPACDLQVKVLDRPGPRGGHKFKVIGVVVHDSPHVIDIPLLGRDGHDDYVEAKVSGFLPGGFQQEQAAAGG